MPKPALAKPHSVKRYAPKARRITPALLRAWPVPAPESAGDKEARGRVLIVGGSCDMPGAILLAATAALRAGAGKLQIATCRSVKTTLAVAVPEARVYAYRESKDGGIAASAAKEIGELARDCAAVLIGPGMIGDPQPIMEGLIPRLGASTLVLDAEPLAFLSREPTALHPLHGRVILTPHAGEMAKITGLQKSEVARAPSTVAVEAAQTLGAIVALKGAETYIASPSGDLYENDAGNIGLATSGSGDVLAGLVAGLAARGCEPIHAAVWGVHTHARAGDMLAARIGLFGYLAREIVSEIPSVLRALSQGRGRARAPRP